MSRQITELDIKRIAMVDRPANKRHYLLLKRDDSEDAEDLEEGKMKDGEGKKKEADDRHPEDSLPEEVVGAGLPTPAKRAIVNSLKDMNKAVTSLAKLLGYGFEKADDDEDEDEDTDDGDGDESDGSGDDAKDDEGDDKDDAKDKELTAARERIAELEGEIETLTETVDDLKDSVVTTGDVQEMLTGDEEGGKDEE